MATKTKTTKQRVSTVRKTILADIRALDKARRRLIDANDSLVIAMDSADTDTATQLMAIQTSLTTGMAILNGALDDRAARLVGTYTAR